MRRWVEDFTDAPDIGPCRVYLDPRDETIFALVSPEDYVWAVQWRWHWKFDKRGRKRYAQRSTRVLGRSVTVFLHKEVLLRSKGPPPSPEATLGDHRDGDSLNCTRSNLDWATRSQNNANRAFTRCPKGRFS